MRRMWRELWPCPRGAAVCRGISAFCAVHVFRGRSWYVYFHAHTDYFFARLGEEGTLLPLKEATGGTGPHLGEVGRGRGGKEGHEFVTGWGCRVLARRRAPVLSEVKVWSGGISGDGGDEGGYGGHLAESSGRVAAYVRRDGILAGDYGRLRWWWSWKKRKVMVSGW